MDQPLVSSGGVEVAPPMPLGEPSMPRTAEPPVTAGLPLHSQALGHRAVLRVSTNQLDRDPLHQ